MNVCCIYVKIKSVTYADICKNAKGRPIQKRKGVTTVPALPYCTLQNIVVKSSDGFL